MGTEDRLVQQELERKRKRDAKKAQRTQKSQKAKKSSKSLNTSGDADNYPMKNDQGNPKTNDKQLQKEQRKKKIEEKKKNNELIRSTMFFGVLFLAMIGYYVYFLSTDAKHIVNNSYNKRIANYANTIVRGKIMTSDDECIAYTDTKSDGEEVRVYPYNELFSHIVGINSLERGKTGLEKSCDYYLLTSNINPILKAVYEFKEQKCLGNDVYTTLDTKVQKSAYDALGNNDGAVVVMNSDTGEILAMVSKPDYNPNELDDIWKQIDKEEADGDESSEKGSFLLNRATQGKYIPGSIFKMFTTLEYLRQNDYKDDFSFHCDGEEYNIKCYNGNVHGDETLTDAFAYSCNGAFATIGHDLDMDKMNEDMNKLLFNSELPLDFEYSKSKFSVDNNSSEFDKTQTAIGQGFTTVTPIHMAMVVQAIANDGMMMKPFIISEIKGYDGKTLEKNEPKEHKRMLTKKESSMLQGYMNAVVDYGTARNLNSELYECGGKTGTAQIDKNNNVNSWFVGYAKNGDKNITISVCVENVQDGTVKAVDCVKKILDEYYK